MLRGEAEVGGGWAVAGDEVDGSGGCVGYVADGSERGGGGGDEAWGVAGQVHDAHAVAVPGSGCQYEQERGSGVEAAADGPVSGLQFVSQLLQMIFGGQRTHETPCLVLRASAITPWSRYSGRIWLSSTWRMVPFDPRGRPASSRSTLRNACSRSSVKPETLPGLRESTSHE